MKYDLTKLKNKLESYIEVDDTYTFSEEELKNSGIIKLDNLKVTGSINLNAFDEVEVSLLLKGIMVLPSSTTLEPVNYNLDIQIDENIDDFIEETGENSIFCENTLDILPIIWENILVEIPMKVVSNDNADITLSGDGWKVITEYVTEQEVNPELAKLKDLL